MKKYVAIFLSFVLLVFGVANYLPIWLDKQPFPQISDSRIFPRIVGHVYPALPIWDKEKNVGRTIKLANLVVTSELHRKSIKDLADDLSMSYRILSNLLEGKHLPDETAYLEVALERLILFNRMQSIAIKGRQRIDGEHVIEPVIAKASAAYDNETTEVIQRELTLYQLLTRKPINVPKPSKQTEQGIAANDLYVGLALCAMEDENGADSIASALNYFSTRRGELIYLINRNADHPLISAGMNSLDTSKCNVTIRQLLNRVGG